jgi:DNA repair exonuclease SbcCD ATPase subunit
MGWCHEFGPQITESCDHPMAAGPSSCSCERCGAFCTGRFGGCADVWDKAPGSTVPVPLATVRLRAGTGERVPAPDRQSPPSAGVLDHTEPAGLDGPEVSALLAHLFERVEALESAPPALEEAVASPRPQQAELGPLKELAERTADQLDQHRARTIERLDELAASTAALTDLPDRVSTLEWVGDDTTAVKEALTELGRGLDRLSIESERSVADLGASVEELAERIGRLGALPQRVEALEQAEQPVTTEVIEAVHARLEQLAGQAEGTGSMAARVDALERAAFGGGPVHSRSRSIVADVDALQRQVEDVAGAVDGVPQRLATVERAAARTEALERGLAGAIDMIDQLVAQLAALEWAYRPLPPPDQDG